jgi:quercetin dioxygenase-like cupin family protein
MKRISLYESSGFEDNALKRFLVHESPYFKIINFNFRPGQELPIHSHDIEGQLSITIIEGVGEFLGKDGGTLPARTGDVLISDIAEPHGLRAKSDLRALVTIAPPI